MDHEILRSLREVTTLSGPLPEDLKLVRSEEYDYVVLCDQDAGEHYEECYLQAGWTLASTHDHRLPTAWKIMRYLLDVYGHSDPVRDLPDEVWAGVAPYGRAREAVAEYRKIGLDRGLVFTEVEFPLLDSDRVEVAWPTREEIQDFEAGLIEDAIEHFIRSGTTLTYRDIMRDKYSFGSGEARWAIEAAATELRQIQGLHVEAQRVLTQIKLEEFTESAKDNLQLQQQIQGLKAQAVVLGLGKVDPEDDVQSFVKEARKFAEAEARRLPAPVEGTPCE